MDGDLQHDPSEIPHFLEKIEDGYDVVSGWRKQRIDSLLMRRIPSLIANKMMSFLSGVKLHDFGTTFKAYRQEIIKEINLYGDLHRFIPILATQAGARIYEIPIKNTLRRHGKGKYTLSRATRVLFDIMTLLFFLTYSTRPMHFWGRIGLFFASSGALILTYTIVDYLIWQNDLRGTMQVGVMFIVLGINLFATGIVLEFLVRIHYETSDKKIYHIKEIIRRGDSL